MPTGKTSCIERLPEIPNFTLLVGWTGQVAITDSLIQATEKKRKVETDSAFTRNFSKESRHRSRPTKCFGTNKTSRPLQEGIRSNRALLNEFAQVMQLKSKPCTPNTLRHRRTKWCLRKTSGAGGGDCGI